MILHVESDADADVLDLREAIEREGLRTRAVRTSRSEAVIRCIGDTSVIAEIVSTRTGVRVLDGDCPYPLVAAHPGQSRTAVGLGSSDVAVGGERLAVIAGPCSVENRRQIVDTAVGLREAGAHALRGGAYKPRTSPYPFQGLEEEGLELLAEARRVTGLPVVTEVMDTRLVGLVAESADVLQVGARNMQNYPLLDEVGRVQRPVLLKRGPSATVEETLLAAERIVLQGNAAVVLCERGIRTYETATRNTLDVSAIAVLRERSHLPVVVDPSHAAGRRSLVPTLALAGVAAGADGVIVEVHVSPDDAITDANQALSLDDFAALMPRIDRVGRAVGRPLLTRAPCVGGAA